MEMIDKQIKTVLGKLYVAFGSETPDVPKAVVYFSTSFFGPVSNTVSKRLHNLMGEFYPQIALRIVYSDSNTLGNRFTFKDKASKLCSSNLVYKYTCELCKEFYIGKTIVQFRNRIRQHQGLTVRTGKACEGEPPFSEIRNHCTDVHQSTVNPDSFKVLAKLRFGNDLEHLESLYQRSLKPKIINQVQSVPLLCYDS
jgi:hypothetical protein